MLYGEEQLSNYDDEDETQPVKRGPLPMYNAEAVYKMETTSVLDCFPFPTIRPAQKRALEIFEQGVKDGKKIFMFDLPTGAGKSGIAAALARWLGTSYILTGTKDLQRQYIRDFEWMLTAKGKSNFECFEVQRLGNKIDSQDDLMCHNGPCSLDSKYKCPYKPKLEDYGVSQPNTDDEKVNYVGTLDERADKPCTYYDQKYRAIVASHSVFNMAMFYTNAFYGLGLPRRKLLVIDEAHECQSHLTEFQGMSITARFLGNFFEDYDDAQLPKDFGEDLAKWSGYLENLTEMLRAFIKEAEERNKAGSNNKRFSTKNIQDAKNLKDKISEVIIDITVGNQWVVSGIIRDAKSDRVVKVTFKPLDIKPIAKRLFAHGDYLVMMSATILGKKAMCEMLGLAEDDVVYIQTESDFPLEHRPIYSMNLGKYSRDTEQQMLPKFAAYVDKIMTKHAGQKGIIHVSKKAHMKAIEDALSPENKRRLLKSTTDEAWVDREQLMREHAESKQPTVIISPSFHTGADLVDDLSRFQIIFKIPYGDLSDKVISARAKESKYWYNWQTILKVIQSYGRSVRSKDDWATTYVLDSNINFLMWKCGQDGMVPNWFKKAIIQSTEGALETIPATIAS